MVAFMIWCSLSTNMKVFTLFSNFAGEIVHTADLDDPEKIVVFVLCLLYKKMIVSLQRLFCHVFILMFLKGFCILLLL